MHDPSKGRANSISGIPLAGATPQLETGSVEPNRLESDLAFHPEGKDAINETYFTAEEQRLGENDGSFIGTKNDEQWSEGLADECNPEESNWDEDQLPEIQPLHLIGDQPNSPNRPDEFSEIELQPNDESESESESESDSESESESASASDEESDDEG
jgi:hypothetical protein